MPIGKDSITKRVAKPTENTVATEEKNIAPELVATVAAAPKKAPAKKATTSTTTKKTTSTTATKKPAAKTAPKTAPKAAPKTEKKVDTTVLGNVSPETVKAVTGHEENKGFEKVQLGQKLPEHLL